MTIEELYSQMMPKIERLQEDVHEIKIKQERHDTIIKLFTWAASAVMTAAISSIVLSIFALITGAR